MSVEGANPDAYLPAFSFFNTLIGHQDSNRGANKGLREMPGVLWSRWGVGFLFLPGLLVVSLALSLRVSFPWPLYPTLLLPRYLLWYGVCTAIMPGKKA
jgi:hypothetical protein